MSPIRTFQSWGSSSKWCFRKNCPQRVKRVELLILTNCGPSASALSSIVRNLMMWKGFPPFPMRSCLKKGVPGVVNHWSINTAKKMGEIMTIPTKEKNKSKSRFETRWRRNGFFIVSRTSWHIESEVLELWCCCMTNKKEVSPYYVDFLIDCLVG